MKRSAIILLLGTFYSYCQGQQAIVSKSAIPIPEKEKTLNSQWSGKKIAFLGDSMTDKKSKNTKYLYWQFLASLLGIEPYVYGINGHQWSDIYGQANRLFEENKDNVDAIIIFAGTNDFNHGVPIGDFFEESHKQANHNGKEIVLNYRKPIYTDSTFCGRINKVMNFLKSKFPTQQIIIMTPLHRGYAEFNDKNIQPDEGYANEKGIYFDTYVKILKEAANDWAVPIIDLYSISGLYPLSEKQSSIYFHDVKTDCLHPNTLGNYRLAKTIQYQLLTLPSSYNF